MVRAEDNDQEQYMQGLGEKDDVIGKVTEVEMLENLENDVDALTKAVENAQKDLDNFKPQLELDERLWNLLSQPGALRKKKSDFVFEDSDEYWDINEKRQAFKIRQDRALARSHLTQLENTVEDTTRALERAKEKLAKFQGE